MEQERKDRENGSEQQEPEDVRLFGYYVGHRKERNQQRQEEYSSDEFVEKHCGTVLPRFLSHVYIQYRKLYSTDSRRLDHLEARSNIAIERLVLQGE